MDCENKEIYRTSFKQQIEQTAKIQFGKTFAPTNEASKRELSVNAAFYENVIILNKEYFTFKLKLSIILIISKM